MAEDLAHEFLLKEYENAAQVTFHADEFRDKLSTFFLSFAGAAVALVGLVIQDSIKVDFFGEKTLAAGLFLIGVSVIGLFILCIHARLRRVQLEHFAMINRIRLYCIRGNLDLWNTIGLSFKTLPKVKFGSGSELWALTILLPTAVLLGIGVDFLLRWWGKHDGWHFLPLGVGLVGSWLLWLLYAHLARTPTPKIVGQADLDEWLSPANLDGTGDSSSDLDEAYLGATDNADETGAVDSSANVTIKLPESWSNFLLTQPESGVGFHRVDVWLDGDRVLHDVVVFNALTIEVPEEWVGATIQDLRLHGGR